MRYYLLTGATGLLGRYLVRELLEARLPLAVLVRPGKLQSPEDRIEAIMRRWERQAGRCLPRPVILGGDLCQPGLGLQPRHARWIADHCEAVIHSAASMTFRADNRGEPWQTNVEGARNLLNFCLSARLQNFHHVSTAYVCGLREGRVLETELDVGQKLGNVYEESKIAAEKMLREAGFERLTVYRPASIIGDSRDGFTSSYHGFYLPLQLAHLFSGELPPEMMNDRFWAGLGLTGQEGKNFVPVDWVAAAIAYLVSHPECHGQTYHIASPKTVTVRVFEQVVQDAIRQFVPKRPTKEVSEKDLAVYQRLFYEQMSVYRSHWRDDPTFDLANTARALPQLPCPEMDYDLLMRVARYPIEKNFGLLKHEEVPVPFDVRNHVERFLGDGLNGDAGRPCVNVQVNGSGGGQWRLYVRDGGIAAAELGLGPADAPRCYLNAATFASLVRGETSVRQAIAAGRVFLRAAHRPNGGGQGAGTTRFHNAAHRITLNEQQERQRMSRSPDAKSAVPLAIIGMACRLPGADNLDQFWRLLIEGRTAIRELPADRLDQSLYYDSRKGVVGKTYSKLGAILSSRQFHHDKCPIPDELVHSADPCHLLMCEVAADACRHAGLDPFHLPLTNTGVFIGHAQGSGLAGDYTYATCIEEAAQFLRESEEFGTLPPEEQKAVMQEIVTAVRSTLPRRTAEASDIAASGIAGTVSRAFGLSGPYLALNSACASSLQAMLLGARALQLGRIDMAIVGGASDCKSDSLVLFAHAQTLSTTGSRPFDADADGLVVGEGYVCLVMKTLPRAQADGDRVLAVVRGLGVSSDGRGKSLWAPRQEGQIKAMQRAYRDGLDMAQLQYLEAHATATQVGDATELNTVAEVLKNVLPPGRKIPITSVKANIGHTLESAGLAGVIKTVLAMQHRMIPPAVNIRQLNPKIDWPRVPVYVPTSPIAWPDPAPGQPRRAGVNAFGIGGLNMHVVLDEPIAPGAAAGLPGSPGNGAADSPRRAGKTAGDDRAIAVVGMGCVLPGAANVAKYWDLLAAGRDPKCPPPSDRWRIDLGYRPGSREPYCSPAALGGFITDFHYDWRVHKLPPKQIAQADPLQFMLLEAADEALKDAGYDRQKLRREGVGVVVGTEFGGDFACQLQMALRLPAMQQIVARSLARRGLSAERIGRVNEQFAAALLQRWPALVDDTGSFSTSSLASQIGKTWDLMGGAASIDAGAASSLAALAISVDLLLCGDCEMMICAAGQRRMGLPAYEAMSMAGLLSVNPQPRSPFDAQADGYVPAEGVGVVLLKRLPDAVRDGDKIHAVIRGVAAGRDDNLAEAVQQAMCRGLSDSAIRPEEIALLETDGLAQPQADRAQLDAVLAVQSASPRREPLWVGSVVGQIGHAGGASGMASLLKAVLEVERGQAARTVGLETPLPLPPDKLRPIMQPAPVASLNGRDRPVAGVTSCSKDLAYHVIVESGAAAPAVAPVAAPTVAPASPSPAAETTAGPAATHPVAAAATFTSADQWSIVRVGAANGNELLDKLSTVNAESLFAAAAGSRFGPADRARAAIVAANPAALGQKLAAAKTLADPAAWPVLAQQGIFCRQLGPRRPRIAFLFPGQGSQYPGMLRELVRDVPAAAATMRKCSDIMASHGWPTFAEMAWSENPPFGSDLFLTQAAMLLADAIMLAAMEERGIQPALVAGHSYGEYPALLAAGVWDIEQALRATRARCDAIQSCPTARGTMLATTAPLEVVEELLASLGELVFVANHNAPDQVVVAGAKASLERVSAVLAARSYQCRALAVPSVFHTPLMQGAVEPFAAALRTFAFAAPKMPLFSSVANRYLAGPQEVAANLTAQLVTPVRYVDLVRQITAEHNTVLVEVGPQQALTRLNQKILKGTDAATIACDNPKRPGVEQICCAPSLVGMLRRLGGQRAAGLHRGVRRAGNSAI